MTNKSSQATWGQLGASIETLENAINHCPDNLWGDMSKSHPFWYMAFHTLFWLDFYFSDDINNFKPPEPFGLEEMDPAGVLPSRVYSKKELLKYLEHGKKKAKNFVMTMTEEKATGCFKFGRTKITNYELIFYQMRHVQHQAHCAGIPMPSFYTVKMM